MIRRLRTQLRESHAGHVMGFDQQAAFEIAAATGVSCSAVAQFLPLIEIAMVSKLREQNENDD